VVAGPTWAEPGRKEREREMGCAHEREERGSLYFFSLFFFLVFVSLFKFQISNLC
jgi:hypothetical protein